MSDNPHQQGRADVLDYVNGITGRRLTWPEWSILRQALPTECTIMHPAFLALMRRLKVKA